MLFQSVVSSLLPLLIKDSIQERISPFSPHPSMLTKPAFTLHPGLFQNTYRSLVLRIIGSKNTMQFELIETERKKSSGGLSSVAFLPVMAV